ncbi:hypothetical protein C8R46DRAFT_1212337 [Mycena filopes]|nr:hypothetical protein C8R46DRAFT_1212337 [Mycena filopes]
MVPTSTDDVDADRDSTKKHADTISPVPKGADVATELHDEEDNDQMPELEPWHEEVFRPWQSYSRLLCSAEPKPMAAAHLNFTSFDIGHIVLSYDCTFRLPPRAPRRNLCRGEPYANANFLTSGEAFIPISRGFTDGEGIEKAWADQAAVKPRTIRAKL